MAQSCDSCSSITPARSRCRPCGVELCGACLRGTDRCPSCQRRFATTRFIASPVQSRGSKPWPVPLTAGLVAIAVAAIYAGVVVERDRPTSTGVGTVDRQLLRRNFEERQRQSVLVRRGPQFTSVTTGPEACRAEIAPPESVPAPRFSRGAVDGMRIQTVLVLIAPNAEILSREPRAIPFLASNPSTLPAMDRDSTHRVTLLVDEWREATTEEGSQLRGQLFAWSYDAGAVVCAADVDVSHDALLDESPETQREAKVELALAALRTGIRDLRTVPLGGRPGGLGTSAP